MENRTPTSIFTDQDQEMANAIEQVLPNTRHRLCIRHLEQNAIIKFGALKKDKEFKDFEEEFGYSMATTVQMIGRNEECLLYQVALEDKPWSSHQNSTLAFSNKYVSEKWTKVAKTEAWDRLKNQDPTQQYIPWRQTMMRKFYNLILKSQENEETRAFMEESFGNSL
ncbi:uncharacterized protein LOC110691870 [Chenopodium quinoa]|uniref:uncharacterized protein LOC110691870 n=1 Tax=Chenopodium quinoa TaxID=63459 RepID=UPI000B784CEF|nr:uncharacterized protein LOC110691870 [Chenopodium quinoa]